MKKKTKGTNLNRKREWAVIETVVGTILTIASIVGLFFSSWATIPLIIGGIVLEHSGTAWTNYVWEKEQHENK